MNTMGLLRYTYRSEILSLSINITVAYPSERLSYQVTAKDGQFGKTFPYSSGMTFQTIYLLHGGSDDDTLPFRFTNIERYAVENCVMIVCAQACDSFYIDTAYGFPFFQFFTEELPRVVQALFASSPLREDNFVVGFAMGGNGALSFALRKPDFFSAAVNLSGGIGCMVDEFNYSQQMKEVPMPRLRHAFGYPNRNAVGPDHLFKLATQLCQTPHILPSLYIAVGENDFIRNTVRRERDALQRAGLPFHYEEAPGLGHEWKFWDIYFKKALEEWLPLKRKPIY